MTIEEKGNTETIKKAKTPTAIKLFLVVAFLGVIMNASYLLEAIKLNLRTLFLVLLFMSGALIQTYLLIKKNLTKDGVFLAIFALATSFFVSLLLWPTNISFYSGFVVLVVIFSASIVSLFKNKILVQINKTTLLLWLILFWYIFLVNFTWNLYLITLFSIPACLILIITFLNFNLPLKWNLFSYLSYLAILITLAVFQLNISNIAFFLKGELSGSETIIGLFFSGMIFMYAFTHLWFILFMLPLRTKKETKGQRYKKIKEHAEMISSYFSNDQFNFKTHLAIISLLPLLLFANYHFGLLSDSSVISLGAITTSFLINIK